MRILLLIPLITLGLSLQSCDNAVEPANAQTEVRFQAATTQNTLASGRTLANGLTFTEATIGVTKIELEGIEPDDDDDAMDEDSDDSDDENETEYEGQYVIDLISGTSTPELGLATLDAGTYTELEIEMKSILENNNTLFLAFYYVPDGSEDTVFVEYSNATDITYQLENEQGLSLEEGTVSQLIIQLDLDALFGNVNLSSATPDNDGVVRINDNSNSEISDFIAANLGSAFEAGEDTDEDGDLDEDD